MKPKAKREPVKVYGRGAVKPEPKPGPNFIFSSDLQAAAFNLWGRCSSTQISEAMKDPKSRQLLRAEQLRLALMKKHGPATEAPVSDNADDPPAA
jgi:hypothetical protein